MNKCLLYRKFVRVRKYQHSKNRKIHHKFAAHSATIFLPEQKEPLLPGGKEQYDN